MSDHNISGQNLFQIQICSTGTEAEALEWTQQNSPAGTSLNWQKYDWETVEADKPFTPCKCADDATRKHYVFRC